MSFKVGSSVGAYTIVEKLGAGGMATVYKARHERLDRYVAIKVLHAAYHDKDSFLRRFNREAKVVARLEHPNIVPVYDFASYDGYLYLVMRYIEGETLKARLARQLLSQEEILRIADAVAAGIDYAHENGTLHRDIKPSNILLTAVNRVYITDFGLAKVAQSGESTLSQGMIMGTPHYISPEQAKGTTALDGRTDIYSFGVILYQMTTGRLPFQGQTDFSIIHAQIFDPPPPPSQFNDTVSTAVEAVLLKALQKEPDNRYATASDLVAAFREALTTQAVDTAVFTAIPPLPDLSDAPSSHIFEEEAIVPAKRSKRPFVIVGIAVFIAVLLCLCLLLILVNQ